MSEKYVVREVAGKWMICRDTMCFGHRYLTRVAAEKALANFLTARPPAPTPMVAELERGKVA